MGIAARPLARLFGIGMVANQKVQLILNGGQNAVKARFKSYEQLHQTPLPYSFTKRDTHNDKGID